MNNKPLFKHQEDDLSFMERQGWIYALWCDMGTGKTRTAIEGFKRIRERDKKTRMIVFTKKTLIDSTWGFNVAEWSDFKFCNLQKKFDSEAQVFGINYEILVGEKLSDLLSRLKSTGDKWLFVGDESARIKNPQAESTKKILRIKNFFDYRFLLSGTPAPNIEWEYWSQMTFLRDGIFNPNFYAFKNQYFHLSRGEQIMNVQGNFIPRNVAREIFSHGWQYAITEAKRLDMLARMRPWCSWRKKEECLDLPEEIDEEREVELSDDQKRAYKEMKEDLITVCSGQEIAVNIALAKIMKLRQITSGFVYNAAGQAVLFEKNPKLKELMDVLEELGDRQVVIWGNFNPEIEMIAKALGDKAVTLYGGTKDKDREENKRKFISGEKQYFIVNPEIGGEGLDLFNACYEIFYSLDYSFRKYTQARARIHRQGQTQKCTFIHLLAKKSVDTAMLSVVRKKASVHDFIFEVMQL